MFDWQLLFILLAIPTGLLILSTLKLRHPLRGETVDAELAAESAAHGALPFGEARRQLFGIKALKRLYIGGFFLGWGLFPLASFTVFFFENEFDFGTAEIGKPVGIDIKEKKMTLPLIYSLQQADWLTRRRIIYNVKNNDGRKDRVQAVIEFVKKTGGLDYAIGVMERYRDEALAILRTFPASPSRSSLEQLINYTIERDK